MILRPPLIPNRSPFLAEPAWVEQNLSALTIFDATFVMPNSQINATGVYLSCHLPGAQRFDVDIIKDTDNPLPHMLPKKEQMTKYLRDLGVQKDSIIVVYDQQGISARVWWMLRAYGFDNCFILDGGLIRWLQDDRPTESGNARRAPSDITVTLRSELVSDRHEVQHALNAKTAQVVDARAEPRFRGEVSEPRPGLRSGHMPGAINLPYAAFIENGSLKTLEELRSILKKANIDPARKVVSLCGSGVSAAILCLVLSSLGYDNWSLYDGSWAEWGANAECAVVSTA
jgi:thiosulfate/3-mercaptopyruvate sulfurtransferase